jgi:hypothetical protein
VTDNKKKTGRQDRTRVNVREPYELAYWTTKFGCTAARLVAAVGAVGVMAADVRKHLKNKKRKAAKKKSMKKKKSK